MKGGTYLCVSFRKAHAVITTKPEREDGKGLFDFSAFLFILYSFCLFTLNKLHNIILQEDKSWLIQK